MNAITASERMFIYRSCGAVKRFHIMRTHRVQTVAEHSHGVAVLVMLIEPECSAVLLKAALTHDFHERATGDLPSTAKWLFPPLAEAMQEAEEKWNTGNGLMWELTEKEFAILTFCDYMELLLWCLEEFELGNRFALEAVRNITTLLAKTHAPNEIAVTLFRAASEKAKNYLCQT